MDSDDEALPRYLQQLWGIDTGRRRGPKPSLAIEDIGLAAVEVADRDGIETVSMKSMAAILGISTMSIYRYLESKEELVSLMLHVAYGRPELAPMPDADWRARLRQWADALAARLIEHPWIVTVPLASPPLEPNVLRWTEAGLQVLSTSTLAPEQQFSALLVVDGFVRSQVSLSLQLGTVGAGRKPDRRVADYPRRIAALVDAETFPILAGSGQTPPSEDFHGDQYGFGMNVILSGLDSLA